MTQSRSSTIPDMAKKVEPSPILLSAMQQQSEVEQGMTMGQQMLKGMGSSPETPPDQLTGALGQLPGSSSAQTGMLRQLQRSYGNNYVGAMTQSNTASPTSASVSTGSRSSAASPTNGAGSQSTSRVEQSSTDPTQGSNTSPTEPKLVEQSKTLDVKLKDTTQQEIDKSSPDKVENTKKETKGQKGQGEIKDTNEKALKDKDPQNKGSSSEEKPTDKEKPTKSTDKEKPIGKGDEASAETDAQTASTAASDIAELATGDLALIDEELAEHQRWGSATDRVGTAGSTQRTAFLAEAAGGGLLGGAAAGFGMGVGMGLAGRGITKAAGKGVVKLATKFGAQGGAQALKFTPLPAVGAVIGGAMSAYALYERDWSATGATIGKFGQGSSVYETLANSIAAVSEIIDVCTNVLNVIAGIIGVISIAMWIITVVTVGIASPLAATLSSIALAIVTATMILDAINAAVLQPCVLLFRSLHAFTSEADPREVEAQGGKLAAAAGASGGALGGFAGGKASEIGGKPHPRAQAPEPTVHPDHPTPPAAAGDGPTVQFEVPPGHAEGVGKPAPASTTDTGDFLKVTDTAPIAPVETPVGQSAHATPVDSSTSPTQSAGSEPPISSTSPKEPLPEVRSDTFFEYPAGRDQGVNPDGTPIAPTHGLQSVEISTKPDPSKIQYHENMAFKGVREVRTADQRAVIPEPVNGEVVIPSARGTQTGVPTVPGNPHTNPPTPRVAGQAHTEGSVIPDSVAYSTPVPEVPFQPPGQKSSPNAGQPYPLQGRLHSSNPSPDLATNDPGAYSRFNATVQVNTVRKQGNQYFHPDGRFIDVTDPNIGPAHLPVGGRATSVPELPPGASPSDYHLYGTRTEKGASPIEIFGRPGVDNLADFDVDAAVSGLNPYLKPMRGSSEPPSSSIPPASGSPPTPITPSPSTSASPVSTGLHSTPTSSPLELKVSEGSTRSQTPLTPAQIEQHTNEAVAMGMPREQIVSTQHSDTAYGPTFDVLRIGPDIHPLPPEQRPTGLPNPANAALEPTAVLAHEIIGHRQAAQAGQTHVLPWAEESQASHRAALLWDGLPPAQRQLLIQDAAARSRLQEKSGKVYMFTEPVGEVGSKLPSGSSPGSGLTAEGLPKVMIDPSIYTEAASLKTPGSSTSTLPVQSTPLPSPGAGIPPSGLNPFSPQGRTPSATHLPPSQGSPSTLLSPVPISATRQLGTMFLPQLFGPGGKPPTHKEIEAAHRSQFTTDNQLDSGLKQQPQVERVNPNYPPPPGTPQQQVDLLNEIEQLLSARAQAEQAEQQMAAQQQKHQANQAPLQDAQQKMGTAITATQAHQQAVARREQINQQQQQRQQESQGLIDGYPNRAGGLTVLTTLLSGFERFTSIASILPDSPDVSLRAKRGLLKMNSDAKKFLASIGQVGASMVTQSQTQPAQRQALLADKDRLQTTNQQSGTSQQQFGQAQDGANALQQANNQKINQAGLAKAEANAQKAELDATADKKKQQAKEFSEQMQKWAQAHKAARLSAIAETKKRLESQGFIVRDSQEK